MIVCIRFSVFSFHIKNKKIQVKEHINIFHYNIEYIEYEYTQNRRTLSSIKDLFRNFCGSYFDNVTTKFHKYEYLLSRKYSLRCDHHFFHLFI
jgi:hypothetical protein